MTLSTGHLLVLDCGVLHDVEALEESALFLTISWRREKNDASESLSSTQRHLDEEALSRMDDEGGAPGATVSPPGTARKAVSGSLDVRHESPSKSPAAGVGDCGCNRTPFIHSIIMR